MTNTESIIEIKPTWWIKYNVSTGKILRLSRNEIGSDNKSHAITITSNELCRDLIRGTVPFKECCVVWDVEDEIWDIDLKGDVLNISNANTNFLYQIKESQPTASDIAMRIYKKENVVELSVNIQNIKKSMNLSNIGDIANKENTLLNLYFTRKNDPDYLIQSVEVDPLLLFRRKTLRFKLDLDWDNVSVFTRPVFKKYSMELLEVYIPTVGAENRQTLLQQSVNSKQDAHLYITATDKNIKIHSDINAQQDYLVNEQRSLKFIVCDTTVDNLVGAFEVPTDDLINEDTIIVEVAFDIPSNPLFIYKNKHIAVNFIGDRNE